jgi:hypothetical protein
VEVLRRYSNRPDLLGPLVDVLGRIEAGDQDDEPGVHSTRRGGRLAPVSERLGEGAIREMVEKFRTGVPKGRLVEEFGISMSSVKRVIRRHRDYHW